MGLASPLLASALLACSAAPAPQEAARPAATVGAQEAPNDPAAVLRGRIASAYGLAQAAAGVQARDADTAAVPTMVRERIEPALAVGAVGYGGQDYHFTLADGLGRHASLWRIRYRDGTAAATAARAIARQRFFAGGVISTPMASARRGDEVLILFTETAGDAKLVALLRAVAGELSAGSPPP